MHAPTPSYRFDSFELRPAQRLLLDGGLPRAVGARAYDLLLVLIERRERVVPHAELLNVVWPGLVVDENNLRQHVSSLRKLLGADAVLTLPGRGYRFGRMLDESIAAPLAPPTSTPISAASTDLPRATAVNNLPANKPTLIGREEDLAAVLALLCGTHLLTLVGAGGVVPGVPEPSTYARWPLACWALPRSRVVAAPTDPSRTFAKPRPNAEVFHVWRASLRKLNDRNWPGTGFP